MDGQFDHKMLPVNQKVPANKPWGKSKGAALAAEATGFNLGQEVESVNTSSASSPTEQAGSDDGPQYYVRVSTLDFYPVSFFLPSSLL